MIKKKKKNSVLISEFDSTLKYEKNVFENFVSVGCVHFSILNGGNEIYFDYMTRISCLNLFDIALTH